MTMMSRASWKFGPVGGTGLLIIIKRTVLDAHDRARMNVARAKMRARVRACADARTTGYELVQLQLASLASRLSH